MGGGGGDILKALLKKRKNKSISCNFMCKRIAQSDGDQQAGATQDVKAPCGCPSGHRRTALHTTVVFLPCSSKKIDKKKQIREEKKKRQENKNRGPLFVSTTMNISVLISKGKRKGGT
eukprot:TRINITY_DN838_c1_g1_i5.p1 TRINITY_DN838_c1_g1~~TRINITY_DN838_c1_g1_i5.p1  ORF type:complete len:118 (-),score=12.96 TRINITY_DN838_c1_g1_i5:378-731(-)